MDRALFYFEIEATKDLLAADYPSMEIVDGETHKGWFGEKKDRTRTTEE